MATVFSLRTVIMSCLFISLLVYRSTEAAKLKCEKITMSLCQNLGYNSTYYPNRFHHQKQTEAALALRHYRPLLRINCAPVLKFFLCSLYAPVCDPDYGKELLPCRSVCEQAKTGCLKIMESYGYKWPERIECHLFPTSKDALCMQSASQTKTDVSPTSVMPTSTTGDNVTLSQKASTNTPATALRDLTQSIANSSVKPTGISTPRVNNKMKCEKIVIPLCENLDYNLTYSPNRFLHEDQKEAALEVHQFWPLVEINCSPVLKFFLCSLYAPVCDPVYGLDLQPCRSVCEQAKTGCLPIMKEYGFKWPEKMECHLFPEKKDDISCLASAFPTSVMPTSGTARSNTTPTSDLTQSSTSIKPTGISTSHVNNRMKCQKLTVTLCENLGYNLTYSPNRFLHEDQKEAALEVHQFWPLVEINCSPVLKFFLCSLYAPVCDPVYGKKIQPCRSVCEKAKSGCLPIMKAYGFMWPEKMDCNIFPKKKDDVSCLASAFPTSVMPTSANARTNTPTKDLTQSGTTKSISDTPTQTSNAKYEKLTIRLCKKLSYNMTNYPNRFGHENQVVAAKQLGKYKPLIRAKDSRCAKVLRYFLCSLYAPPSDVRGKQLVPCRSLCKQAKRKCRKTMKGFGFKWPKNTKCRSFPRRKDNRSCLEF